MSDRGKYHGQRLNAKEVLRLYAAGERDFRGTILRGCNFHEVNLSRADFTGADIRSVRFTKSALVETNFSKVKAGTSRNWFLLQSAIVLVSSVTIIYAAITSSSFLTADLFQNSNIEALGISPGILLFLFHFSCCLLFALLGFSGGTALGISVSYFFFDYCFYNTFSLRNK